MSKIMYMDQNYTNPENIMSNEINYTTTVPTAINSEGLKIAVLNEEPQTKYVGWLYLIKES